MLAAPSLCPLPPPSLLPPPLLALPASSAILSPVRTSPLPCLRHSTPPSPPLRRRSRTRTSFRSHPPHAASCLGCPFVLLVRKRERWQCPLFPWCAFFPSFIFLPLSCLTESYPLLAPLSTPILVAYFYHSTGAPPPPLLLRVLQPAFEVSQGVQRISQTLAKALSMMAACGTPRRGRRSQCRARMTALWVFARTLYCAS